MTAPKKRYAHVGMGGRCWMYADALTGDYADRAELVGICDRNAGRLAHYAAKLHAKTGRDVPTYEADQFDAMIAETKPDTVIVTTGPDATHHRYICRAMELGCDVVSEKPLTVDAEKCREILQTRQRTGRKLQVTFNYRYSPPRSQVKRMLEEGVIGEVLSVDFAWLLDTRHGADYFRRWHRRRENSGSLLVHKSTHHFDLVNWWLSDEPEEVSAMGRRGFYTPATADRLGLSDRGDRCLDCPAGDRCDFRLDLRGNDGLRTLYLENESCDGYFRDRCVFSDEIDIWDQMAVNVRYRRGAILSYMLHANSPYEGYRIAFNGTAGRLEHHACENTYVNGDGSVPGELSRGQTSITLIPEFQRAQTIEVETGAGGHGGGDKLLLADLFDPSGRSDPLGRKADQRDGAFSIAVGVAASRSIDGAGVVKVADLFDEKLTR